MSVQPRDTTDEAREVQIAAYRAMTPSQRVEIAFQLSDDVRALTQNGVRRRHPELDEIDFQPGTWLVRARAIDELLKARPIVGGGSPGTSGEVLPAFPEVPAPPTTDDGAGQSKPVGNPNVASKVRVVVRNVSADKARDVVKVAVLPLSANSVSTTFDIEIHADGGVKGIPKETIDLVVAEGLRQLGLEADITTE